MATEVLSRVSIFITFYIKSIFYIEPSIAYVPRKVDGDCLRELRWFGA